MHVSNGSGSGARVEYRRRTGVGSSQWKGKYDGGTQRIREAGNFMVIRYVDKWIWKGGVPGC